jgi:hypothetical protein
MNLFLESLKLALIEKSNSLIPTNTELNNTLKGTKSLGKRMLSGLNSKFLTLTHKYSNICMSEFNFDKSFFMPFSMLLLNAQKLSDCNIFLLYLGTL